MVLHLLVYIFVCFHFGYSDNTEFVYQPKHESYFVKTNDSNVTLPCAVGPLYAQEPYILNWIKIVNGSPRIVTTATTNRMSDLYDLDSTSCGAGCYNLRIKIITYEQDNAKFFCQITGPNNFLKESQPADVVVLVKPGEAKISVQPTTSIREGTVVTAECQSVGGNPPPRILWFFNNGTEIAAQFAKQTNGTTPTSATSSTLQYIVTPNENGVRILCRVWNEAMGEGERSFEALTLPLSVLYAPRVSVGPASPYNVELGASATLFCSADGNPTPTRFSWFLNGTPQQAPGNVGQNLTFVVTKSNAGRYTCVASSEEDSTGQESLLVNVLHGPEIALSPEYRGVVGRSATLVCTVDANPQASSVSWTGPGGHSSETNILEIASVTLKDMGNYTCEAKNTLNLYSAGSVVRTSTKSTYLVVDHAPGKGIITTPENVVVGSTANLTCRANDVGSPAAEYRWRLPGQSDFETVPRVTLSIPDVQMTHAGDYACLPYNSIGQGEVGTFKLVVYEPAKIDKGLNANDSKSEGDAGYSLSCSAKGYPAPNITFYKDDEILSNSEHWTIKQTEEPNICDVPERCLLKMNGLLEWKTPIRWSDKGVYTCQAYNGAGHPARSNATLKVLHKPVIINDPTRPFVASDVGQTAVVECKANSRPEPTFRWVKEGKDISNDESTSFVQARKTDTEDVYESVLTIRKVQETDMGDYLCKATNDLGENSFKFTLQLKTKPMMPTDVHAVSASHRSITLGWTPGFDGGEDQIFSIEIGYPDNSVRYANATEPKFGRFRRFVGIERAVPVTLNITDLTPSSEYMFRVKAMNRLGDTDWTTSVQAWTDDAPLDSTIAKPTQALYNTDTMVLDFKPTNLDLQTFCLLVYRQLSSGKYATQDCFPPTGKIEKLRPSNNFKIRFCNKQSMACGDEFEVMTGAQSAITWEIIVAIAASAVFVFVVAIVVCVYCYRSRRTTKKTPKTTVSAPSTIARSGRSAVEQRKDYEMETNQVRPNLYQTDKIIGAPSTLDKQATGGSSSKDSGIFTTESNYQYDARYADADRAPSASAGVDNVGMVLNRTPSYDDQEHWGATDGYGLTNPYLRESEAGDYGTGRLSKGGGGDALGSPYYDSYAVDMNPGGANSNDGASLHSGYSTPSGRRVMREIIV